MGVMLKNWRGLLRIIHEGMHAMTGQMKGSGNHVC